ncbi:VOC family protein [Nocardia sp. NPDC051570]|uniref:VOC family protein n=1 Tax=Nocardia sp. NPDC051570 TaxID=3364324 RepID=UPI0037A59841
MSEANNVVVNGLALHHVSINVTDLDRALEFYTGVLGLTRRTDRPEVIAGIKGAWLDAGGSQQIHLMEATDVPPALGQHFALLVDAAADLGDVVAALRAQGLTAGDPFSVAPGRLQSMVPDPDGNVVELHQILP